MTPQEATEAHVAATLAGAASTPWGSPGVAYASAAAYEASVRSFAEAFLRPLDGYLGLTSTQARLRADELGDRLCVHPVQGHRASLDSRRVHVRMQDGVVTAARLDRAPWLRDVVADPGW